MKNPSEGTNNIVVALLQSRYPGSVGAALDQAHSLCEQASKQGADIALFPEMWTTGYEFFDAADPDGQARLVGNRAPRG